MIMSSHLRGGKTAPRLLQDLVDYDPRRPFYNEYNVLTEIPFHDTGKDEDPPISQSGCRHQWAIKRKQANLPQDGKYEPGPSSSWKFACYCVTCRSHLDLRIEYRRDGDNFNTCPSTDRPLHHFLYAPEINQSETADIVGTESCARTSTPWSPKYFRCSAVHCGALVKIQLKPPKLKSDWVSLLTDKFIIKARAEKEMARNPEKFQGHAIPTAGSVLETLAALTRCALFETGKPPYPRDRKSWLLNLGEPFVELMKYLGFTSDGGPWHWPRLNSSMDIPFTDPQRIILDDVREEINALMIKRPDDERRNATRIDAPEFAMREMRLSLGCNQYSQSAKSRTVDLTADEHPCYAGLGSVADFHDDLVGFAYDQQIGTDHPNIPYYLECLQTIADGRTSEALATKAAIEASEGKISLRDVRKAYMHLGYNIHDRNVADETIIGGFQARLSDAPRQEAELRRDLKIVGQHRGSQRIQSVASQAVTNYEQALCYLEADDGMNDEFITSMFTLKVDGSPNEEPTARQAVALIANHRKSKALRHWLDTGALGEVEMDVDQAYARLEITDRKIDDDMIITKIKLDVEEQPSQEIELKRALIAIGRHRKSKVLMDYAGIDIDGSMHPIGEWPVALNNIGNTCYLNSLLQFYFSVKPFRDLVLNIDEYKTPIESEAIKSKRVGGRNVTTREVERAQRTGEELKKLFNALITSPTRSVRPDTEVARLTLLTPKAEIARRQSIRRSMNNIERPLIPPPLTSSDGMAVMGPESLPPAHTNSDDAVMIDSPSAKVDRDNMLQERASNSSSETLVEGPAAVQDAMALDEIEKDQQHSVLNDKENLPPNKMANGTDHLADADLEPLAESSQSRLNKQRQHPDQTQEQIGDWTTNTSSEKAAKAAETVITPSPPNRPPPVPPRPKPSTDANEAVKEAEFAAQQQDVNEIAYNILNQMQCAIKPQAVDDSGEQIDRVKELFYGKQKTYITSRTGEVRTKEEYMSDIKVNVLAGPRDIYAALDAAFDVEDVAVAGGIEPKYYTISQLPPILQIHIQRGQYDPQTKKESKSDNHLDFKDLVYMDRYMDTSDAELLERRKQSWDWKRKLSSLEARRDKLIASELNMNMSAVLESAHGYLQQLSSIEGEHAIEVPPILFEALRSAAKRAKVELESIQTQINDLRSSISSQFSDLRQIPYRLAAVFIHRGSSNAGHYWIYIYDFKMKTWRNYNDEHVTQVGDVSEIFDAPTGQRPPTPYFLVYVKDQLKEELIDPVCRDVVDAPADENTDTVMDDYEPIDITDQIEKTYASLLSPNVDSGPSGEVNWDDSRHINVASW